MWIVWPNREQTMLAWSCAVRRYTVRCGAVARPHTVRCCMGRCALAPWDAVGMRWVRSSPQGSQLIKQTAERPDVRFELVATALGHADTCVQESWMVSHCRDGASMPKRLPFPGCTLATCSRASPQWSVPSPSWKRSTCSTASGCINCGPGVWLLSVGDGE